jgi:regulator of replication initiation timing
MTFKDNSLPAKTAFFHIVKTGGTTFQAILSAIYGDSFRICHDPAIDSIKDALARLNCLEFHIKPTDTGWICLHAELVRQRRWDLLKGWHSFTMLREPVDQVLSQYFYLQTIRAQVEPILHADGKAFADSLTEYLRARTAYNGQLAFLSGQTQREGVLMSRNDLETVKEMLLRLRMHVGLMERFADSMNVFETVTGLTIPDTKIRNQNQNSRRPSLSEVSHKIKDQIRENSALDIELYQFGRELFLEDLSRCGQTREYGFLASRSQSKPTREPESGLQPQAKSAVFFHLMRTAGISFRSFLAALYGDSYHVCDDDSLDQVQADLSRFECNVFQSHGMPQGYHHIHGQLVGLKRWDLLEGKEVFIFLRDPVDHVISQYYAMLYWRPALEALFKTQGTPFPDTLEEYVDAAWHRNRQLTLLMARPVVQTGDTVTRDDLNEAKAMLAQLGCHILLTERFADSLNIFETVMGRQHTGAQLLRIRQNPNRPPLKAIPDGLRERIREENALDMELYEYGRAIFLRDLEKCPPTRAYQFIDQPNMVERRA